MSLSKLSNEILLKKYTSSLKQYDEYIDYFKVEMLENNFMLFDLNIFQTSREEQENLCINLSKLLAQFKKIKEDHISQKRIEKEIDQQQEFIEEPKIVLTSIIDDTDFYNLKTCFCQDTQNFKEILQKYPMLKFYRATYNYFMDYTDKPDYIVKNVHKGHILMFQELQTNKLYGCLRLYVKNNIPTYESLWILNTSNDIKDVFLDILESFNFVEVNGDDFFINDFYKKEIIDDLIVENYIC